MKKNVLLIALPVLLFATACKKPVFEDEIVSTTTTVSTGDNDPLIFGNPTNAKTNAALSDNYLIDQTYYKLAYSSSRAIPVWVAWHLQSEDIGTTPRQDDFRGDPKLPSNWFRVETTNYNSSNFDRGHDIPSADRTASVSANSSTFLMTNIIPQAPMFNQGPWEGLEDYIRNTLVGTTKEAYIFMGNYGVGGYNGNNILANSINNGAITVPAKVYKIAIILPKGTNDLARIDTSAITLVVNMPNDNRLYNTTPTGKLLWKNYITTINAVEQDAAGSGLTLSFLDAVKSDVKTYLKAKKFN